MDPCLYQEQTEYLEDRPFPYSTESAFELFPFAGVRFFLVNWLICRHSLLPTHRRIDCETVAQLVSMPPSQR